MAGKSVIKQKKQAIIEKFGSSGKNTGSAEVQVALLTDRINELNTHFQKFVHDHHSKLGLMKLVGKRKRLLAYLKNTSQSRYTKLLQSLDLRK